MTAALANVRPTHLLDARLWQKLGMPLLEELAGTMAGATDDEDD